MQKADIVVTRHSGLVQFLADRGLVDRGVPVVAHADADTVRGKRVAGVLPLHLVALTAGTLVVDLDIPADLRGADLTADQVQQYCTGARWYTATAGPNVLSA